jgi:FlaA1/EpsC-like NDP-sugar epimerase
MTRFFMTIPEAVSLVVQAGALGVGGEVFVLDMGDPVKIVDVARKMIQLSGKEPDTEIAIRFVGPRPGEKLHEELWAESETVTPAGHPKIMRVTRPTVDADWLDEQLEELERLVEAGETLEVVSLLAGTVRTPRRAGGAIVRPTALTETSSETG